MLIASKTTLLQVSGLGDVTRKLGSNFLFTAFSFKRARSQLFAPVFNSPNGYDGALYGRVQDLPCLEKNRLQKRNGGYRNWKLPRALTFSVREQHFIRLKSCAEHENEGPKSHRATHCSAFDNMRLSTSQKHSNRNQNGRGWDNVTSDTRLLTTFDQAPSKTACRCSNQSLRQRQVDPAAPAIAAPAAHMRRDRKVFGRVRGAHA